MNNEYLWGLWNEEFIFCLSFSQDPPPLSSRESILCSLKNLCSKNPWYSIGLRDDGSIAESVTEPCDIKDRGARMQQKQYDPPTNKESHDSAWKVGRLGHNDECGAGTSLEKVEFWDFFGWIHFEAFKAQLTIWEVPSVTPNLTKLMTNLMTDLMMTDFLIMTLTVFLFQKYATTFSFPLSTEWEEGAEDENTWEFPPTGAHNLN